MEAFFNLIIDYVSTLALLIVLTIVLALLGVDTDNIGENTPGIVLYWAAALIYYVTCECLFGRTLGKLITRSKVVDEQGFKPSFGQVVGRTFTRFVPFEPFSFFAFESRGWHDKWSRTYVINATPRYQD